LLAIFVLADRMAAAVLQDNIGAARRLAREYFEARNT
jgi:hypothetical protein